MAELNPDEPKVEIPTAAPSAEPKTTPESPKDPGGKEPMIPKHRLDEESTKRQEAENRAIAAEKKAEEAAASSKAVEKKLADLATALAGGDITKKEASDEVAALATKYNVAPEFFNDLLSVAKKQALQELSPHIKQSQAANAEAGFREEFQKLTEEIPEAADLTTEEKSELKERAFKKEFWNVPLKSVYRDMMFDKPRGKSATAESSRGGGKTHTNPDEMPSFDMTTPEGIAAFQKYSDNLGRRA